MRKAGTFLKTYFRKHSNHSIHTKPKHHVRCIHQQKYVHMSRDFTDRLRSDDVHQYQTSCKAQQQRSAPQATGTDRPVNAREGQKVEYQDLRITYTLAVCMSPSVPFKSYLPLCTERKCKNRLVSILMPI